MSKAASSLLGIAAVIGAAGIIASIVTPDRHSFIDQKAIRKNFNKAAKNIAGFVDDIAEVIHR